MYLKRKIDGYLDGWKSNPNHNPLIVKGARQIGKTESILRFANSNYKSVVYINFVIDDRFKQITKDGDSASTVIKNITLVDSSIKFVEHDTIIIFFVF